MRDKRRPEPYPELMVRLPWVLMLVLVVAPSAGAEYMRTTPEPSSSGRYAPTNLPPDPVILGTLAHSCTKSGVSGNIRSPQLELVPVRFPLRGAGHYEAVTLQTEGRAVVDFYPVLGLEQTRATIDRRYRSSLLRPRVAQLGTQGEFLLLSNAPMLRVRAPELRSAQELSFSEPNTYYLAGNSGLGSVAAPLAISMPGTCRVGEASWFQIENLYHDGSVVPAWDRPILRVCTKGARWHHLAVHAPRAQLRSVTMEEPESAAIPFWLFMASFAGALLSLIAVIGGFLRPSVVVGVLTLTAGGLEIGLAVFVALR